MSDQEVTRSAFDCRYRFQDSRGWALAADAGSWPQFRGPNGSGLPDVDLPLPDQIGPDKNVLWKTPLPSGHSSPIVVGKRVFVTAQRDKHLVTMALDRS